MCRFRSERTQTAYFRIDASFYSVDEIRSQTLHLSESDPRYDVLTHHDGRDKFLAILLGRHAQQSTGWPEREAHQVRIILLQQNREDRRRAGAQRMSHQSQSELMCVPRRILRRNSTNAKKKKKFLWLFTVNFYLQKNLIAVMLIDTDINIKFRYNFPVKYTHRLLFSIFLIKQIFSLVFFFALEKNSRKILLR